MREQIAPSGQSPFPDGERIPFAIFHGRKLPLGVLAAVATCILLFASHGYPPPDGDAIYFMPPMLSVAKGGKLINDFAEDIKLFDPSGRNRLVFHGYLYPLLVGHLAWKADYSAIEVFIGLINVLTLSATTLLLLLVSHADKHRTAIGHVVMIAAAIPACAVTLLGHSGRNETLGAPILVFGMIGILSTKQRWHSAICGTVIGLLAGTHPMGCILTALLIGLRVFYSTRILDGMRFLSKVGFYGVASWGATFALYPFSLHDWVMGLINNGRLVMGDGYTGIDVGVWFRWMTTPAATAYGIIYMIAGVVAIHDFQTFWKKVSCKLPFLFCAGLLSWAVLNYGYRVPGQNYNLLLFAPLIFVFLIWRSVRQNAGYMHVSFFLGAASTCCFLAAAVGLVRTILIYPYFLRYGLGREEAEYGFDSVRSNYKGLIGLSHGLFTLTDDYELFKGMEIGSEPGYDTFILQQANRGKTEPPQINGYEMVEDRFSRIQPRLFGFKLANTVGGYNYAVYRRAAVSE